MNRKIHIVGDSHLLPFEKQREICGRIITSCIVLGATASGLRNPRSQTLAGPIFSQYITTIDEEDAVIIHLGEVDCGFTMWLRADRENIPIESQIDATLQNYQNLILKIKEKTQKIAVLNILPQTIKDGIKIGDVANLRGAISATQKERMKITNDMNQMLSKFCKVNNILFIDINERFINKETGLVDDYFLNENPEDHHLSPTKFLDIFNNESAKYQEFLI